VFPFAPCKGGSKAANSPAARPAPCWLSRVQIQRLFWQSWASNAPDGIASGQSLRNRKYFLAACLFAPFPYFLWHTSFTAAQKADEEELALSYTLNNAQLIALIGGPFEAYPASATTYQDASKGRHEYAIKGRDNLYVIVDVFRNSGTPQFAIACVTTLSMGKREAGKDDCAQSTVPLPKLSNAQPIVPPDPQ
jgi:hypothetical protein